eukprot:11220851-Lingulodinium_polyedra.AAC.1
MALSREAAPATLAPAPPRQALELLPIGEEGGRLPPPHAENTIVERVSPHALARCQIDHAWQPPH